MTNLVWLTILVIVESIQLVIALIYVNIFIPVTSSLQGQIMPEWVMDLRPEREMLFYRIFILTAIVLEAAAVYTFRSKLTDPTWGRKLRRFLAVESIVLALLCYVVFKILVYHHPYMSKFIWPATLVLALGVKLFWRQLKQAAKIIYAFICSSSNFVLLRTLLDAAIPIFIFLVIYVPNQEAVLARTFVEEQFHHFNTLVMVPAWASSMGCLLNVDINSQYGVGMPMLMGFLAKCMGGVTYANILALLIAACIVYYWLCYLFLRLWLKSALLAAIGIVLALKWQMFNPGYYPFVFAIPNGLPIRHFWDIVFFLLLYRHIQKNENWTILLMGICAGAAEVYISDTGIYLIATYYFYLLYLLAANCFLKGMGWLASLWSLARYFIILPMTTIGVFWLAVGNHVFQPIFWNNLKEFLHFFLDGYGALPMYGTLVEHNFLQNLTGFIIPAVYILTFLAVSSLVFVKKIAPNNILAAVLAFYGLGLYHHYVNRPASTAYYAECLPYVFILCYWLKHILSLAVQSIRRKVLMGTFIFCLFALVTTHQFVVYPNKFNIYRNPMTDPIGRAEFEALGVKYYSYHLFTRIPEELKLPVNSLGQTQEPWITEDNFASDKELVDYYHKEFDFSKDAQLIARLTPADAKAPLISSFDLRILMQANRKPFFYCFPLLVERPMWMRNFPSTHLHTIARMERTLKQIEEKKPEYIFMEKIFLIDQVSADFYFWSSDVIALINYVRAYYQPDQAGQYLVAMKRKPNV